MDPFVAYHFSLPFVNLAYTAGMAFALIKSQTCFENGGRHRCVLV